MATFIVAIRIIIVATFPRTKYSYSIKKIVVKSSGEAPSLYLLNIQPHSSVWRYMYHNIGKNIYANSNAHRYDGKGMR